LIIRPRPGIRRMMFNLLTPEPTCHRGMRGEENQPPMSPMDTDKEKNLSVSIGVIGG
jgi:hypothetical protein